MEETFTYDDMNRLTGITLKRSSGQDLTCAVTYDALGRMTSRQAVIAVNLVPQVTQVFSQPVFSQPVFDATKVHALASATTTSGIFPPTPQTITYTGFDKVSKVKQGTDSICYTYGFNQQRIYMEEHAGTNYWRTFVTGPYGVFAVVESRNGMDQFHYVLKDNLGSWTTITNATGTVEQQLSYDAWGNLRNPITWANYRAGDTYDGPMFDRGYTGHEHVTAFGLINMNGRMYDPVMGGFLSVDRFVQNPLTAQGFNRYSYCMNNPLRFIDPTGWLPGGGGGNGEHPPGAPYYVDGMLTVNLPEVTIMPFNEESFEYTPNLNGGGGPPQWNNVYGGSSNGSSGSGGGSGSHGKNGRIRGLIRAEIQNTIYNYLIQYEFSNIALGAIIASYAGCDFNKKVFWNYWNGQGDYELTTPNHHFTDCEIETVSVDENGEDAGRVEIHPNPTDGQVDISGTDLKSAEVYNAIGQHVASAQADGGRLTVDLSGEPAGVYFVSVTDTEGRKCVRKVVKR